MELKSVKDIIRNLDAYPKTLEDFRIKTYSGAFVTLVSIVVIVVLFAWELNYYLTPEVKEELFVDMSRGEKLRINLDIVFPRLSCSGLSLDAMDVSGEQHINIEHNLYKRRLGLDGKPLDQPVREETIGGSKSTESPSSTTVMTTLDPKRCESCYGGGRNCCNTCQEVQEAYKIKGWAFPDPSSIAQCVREGAPQYKENEGCQFFGYFEVNRVAGNFHLAPGHTSTVSHLHIHSIGPFHPNKFNITHQIRSLSFGRKIPGKPNPLEDTQQEDKAGGTNYQYFIKVVPTMFARLDGHTLHTNQFAVTRHSTSPNSQGSEQVFPGVFFSYEIAPMMVKYSENYKSFFHFATSICAIVGGVLTIAGMVDYTIYKSSQVLQRKLEIGKLH